MPAGEPLPFPTLPITSEATLAACGSLPVRPGDVFIASYPKSGTTWTQALVSALIAGGTRPRHVSDVAPFLEIDPHWVEGRFVGAPGSAAAHTALGRRCFNTHLLHDMLPLSRDARIVYVVRDGADCALSFFMHLSNQRGAAGSYSKGWGAFFDEWLRGDLPYGRWCDHVRSYAQAIAAGDERVLLVSYEQLSLDLEGTMRQIAAHIGVPPLADVSPFSFASMRAESERYQPESVQWAEGFRFLRKGVVGGGKRHMDVAQLRQWEANLRDAFPGGLPSSMAAALRGEAPRSQQPE